jgi:molybdenum cofactor synthesis domain-containing protein
MNKNVIVSKYRMVEMNDAFKMLKDYFLGLEKHVVEVDITKSQNYICAEDVFSKYDVPRTNTSMMDGYGIDTTKVSDSTLDVVKAIYAGDNEGENIESINKCIYVTTGSSLPANINCVVPIEKVEQIEYNKRIKLLCELKVDQFIRHTGTDVEKGQKLLNINDTISITDISLLSSTGINRVKVYKLPRIGLMSTGNEICDIDNINMNYTVDTNRVSIKLILNSLYPNIDIVDYGIIQDEWESIVNAFDKAVDDGVDMLITSGGVSMGERDLVKKFLEKNGNIVFGRLNMKPGKPTTFATYKSLAVMGLPGNPVSFVVCSYLIVSYALKLFQNQDVFPFRMIRAKLMGNHNIDTERPEYSRGM